MVNLPANDSQAELIALKNRIEALENKLALVTKRPYITSAPFLALTAPGQFAPFSTCSTADFLHPRFAEICSLLKLGFGWHRKIWEWVFIVHYLLESDVIKPGNKGLVFGVGMERLPALFASMGATIVATDAPDEISEKTGWKDSGQYSNALNGLRHADSFDSNAFDANVSFQRCDMNNIQAELTGFDFNWSSCCFEHLGSLEAGIQFVINAVENTLKVGGIAVHTTEFNLSSNEETVEVGGTVIFRHRDIIELIERLESRGHIVQPLIVAPDAHYWDFYVDVPPYATIPHLKLMLDKYVATSVGIVVRRGK